MERHRVAASLMNTAGRAYTTVASVSTTAILDRLLHRSHVLNIRGRSYRLRDLEDALKPPRS